MTESGLGDPIGVEAEMALLGVRFCAGGCGEILGGVYPFCADCLRIDFDLESRRKAAESCRDERHRAESARLMQPRVQAGIEVRGAAAAVFDDLAPGDRIGPVRGFCLALCCGAGLAAGCWIGWQALTGLVRLGVRLSQ